MVRLLVAWQLLRIVRRLALLAVLLVLGVLLLSRAPGILHTFSIGGLRHSVTHSLEHVIAHDRAELHR